MNGKMEDSQKKSLWKKFFGKKEEGTKKSKALEFDKYIKAEQLKEPSLPLTNLKRTTGAFIKNALMERRFETAAFMLAMKGNTAEAEKLADQALKENKYEQAIKIYNQIGNYAKCAYANYLAAEDCLKRGGVKKIVISKLFSVIEAYNNLLKKEKENPVPLLKEMVKISEKLSILLEEIKDILGCADCYFYIAQLYKYLSPYQYKKEVYSQYPEFFYKINEKAKDNALLAKKNYLKYIESESISPQDEKGKKIIPKLRKIEEFLSK